MEKEEEEALIVKVLESLVGDEPFHSSNVNNDVLLDAEEEDETESMMPRSWTEVQFNSCCVFTSVCRTWVPLF